MAVRERVQPFAMKFLLSVLTVGCPRQRSYNFWQVRRAETGSRPYSRTRG